MNSSPVTIATHELRHMGVDDLVPYERNARTHSDEQVAQIAASIREFGFNNPILIDSTSGIIAGHGRLLAARVLGLKFVPVIELSHLSDAKKRAYIIADNRLALDAGWNYATLAREIEDIALDGIDVNLLGFTHEEMALIEKYGAGDPGPLHPPGPPDDDGDDALLSLTPAQRVHMNAAWQQFARESLRIIDALEPLGVLFVNATRGAAKINFLRALYGQRTIGRSLTLAYTPQRARVAGDDCSLYEGLTRVSDGRIKPERLEFVIRGAPIIERLSGTLPFAGARLPMDFPVELAQSLIAEFCPAGGSVLDPCHGWGGRALGFLLSTASTYVGFDPSPDAHEGLLALADDLLPYTKGKTLDAFEQCFEDAPVTPACFDFALTSPPYFDVEKYTGESSSWRRYGDSFEQWVEGFYRPLIAQTSTFLKPGGMFALQVGNQRYPLEATAIEIALSCSMTHAGTRATDMTNSQAQTSEERGEVVVLLRRNEAKP